MTAKQIYRHPHSDIDRLYSLALDALWKDELTEAFENLLSFACIIPCHWTLYESIAHLLLRLKSGPDAINQVLGWPRTLPAALAAC